jgi:hypothetical protein
MPAFGHDMTLAMTLWILYANSYSSSFCTVGPPKYFVKSTTETVFAYGYDRQRAVSVTAYAEVVFGDL